MIVYLLNTGSKTEERLRGLIGAIDESATFVACGSVDAALEHPAREDEVLILGDCSPDEQEMAAAARLEDDLPRWAVFQLGWNSENEDVVPLPMEAENEAFLADLFRLALDRHVLRRQSGKMVSDFQTIATRVCHDLRTPLTSIQTASYGLKMLCGEAPEKLLSPISGATRDLARLTDQLALFSRSYVVPPLAEVLPMREPFEQARASVKERLARFEIKLRAPEDWPRARGQPSWITHIWETFLAFAVQRSQGDAQIEVSWSEADGDTARFELAARGLSVDQDEMDFLFCPFHLLGKLRGRGDLRFSLAVRFAALMGGSCGGETLDDGVRFHFTLLRR